MALWKDKDWAVYVGKEAVKVADYFRSQGYPVTGVSNGKPEIDSGFTPFPSAERMQELAIEALSGKASETPSKISTVKNTRRRSVRS